LIAGAHEIYNLNPAIAQTRTILKVFPYDQLPLSSPLKHDLAIIKTNLPFQINQFVKEISLPAQGFKPPDKNDILICREQLRAN
jgi:hypothetical protein